MKPIAVYVLFLGSAMATYFSLLEKKVPTYNAQLESINLESPDQLTGYYSLSGERKGFGTEDNTKAYHIFFENKTMTPIKVAIRYKEIDGEWSTKGLTKLAPGERKLMGKSDEKTYFYHVAKKVATEYNTDDSFKFSLKSESGKELIFKKKQIWECYDMQVCNAFAVFR
ncbi:MAG: hypothetical protein ACJAVN_000988 [Roseivirga sp.]|jgi:hypothetical protein